MDIIKAASNSLTIMRKNPLTEKILEKQDEDGISMEHAAWMLNQIVRGEIEGEKAHRWLGYAQGLLVANGVANLEACKYANLFA